LALTSAKGSGEVALERLCFNAVHIFFCIGY